VKKQKSSISHSIGTAGWTIPKTSMTEFPQVGSHLQRYSESLNAVEINSSFYRPHQAKTYKRWADESAAQFTFAVKLAKQFTHERKLEVEQENLADWLTPVRDLGDKFGALLVQIPPKQEFNLEIANSFFKNLRAEFDGLIALEPRHFSWTTKDARELLGFYDITKV
jgi:uncharacterized protein YecE (DUF72 family)